MTAEEIKVKLKIDNFIKKMKGQVRFKDRNKADLPGCNYYSIFDDILMYADCMVILLSLQKTILSEFHSGHFGMSRMKSLLRSYMFWLIMNKDIEKPEWNRRGCAPAVKSPQ